MFFRESDHRTIRKDAQGNRFEYSDSAERPHGEGWERVDPMKHPHARVYLWFRPYAAAVREYHKKPRMLDNAPKSLQIETGLADKLGAGFAEELNKIRDELRQSLSRSQNDFYTGDRVKVKDKNGAEHVAYVKRVDSTRNRYILQRASDGEPMVGTHDNMSQDLAHMPVSWSKGDLVTVDGKAAGLPGATAEGTVIGFDNFSNKLRVLLGTKNTVEVFPEAILGVRGKNPEILRKAAEFLDKHNDSFSSPPAKSLLESLLRATLEGRESVSVKELRDDIKAVTGQDTSPGFIRGELGAMATLFKDGKDQALFFNPATDSMFLRDGFLAVRLMANSRGVKKSTNKFGWKNITKEDPDETYAHVGQRVWADEENMRVEGVVKRIEGNKAEVLVGGQIKHIALNELSDLHNRRLLPDPTDPAAFGALNRNSFWLLRDREWCKDFKDGDVVSLLNSLTDPSGKRAKLGDHGKIIGRSVDGRLTVEMDNGKKVIVTPRQLRQVREMSSIHQMLNRVDKDPQTVYGTTTVIRDGDSEARIAIGGERRDKFIHMMFPNLNHYTKMESSLFEGVMDDQATMNRTRMIMPLDEGVQDRTSKTLIPNATMYNILRKMYPTASRVLITRRATTLPGTMRVRPDADPATQAFTKAEVKKKVAAGEKPVGEDYFDPDNTQGGKRKSTSTYKDYYEPDDAGFIYDPDKDAYKPQGEAPAESSFFSRIIRSNPFRKEATPVGPTLTYSAADVDKLNKETPVVMRIQIDPTPTEIKASNGVVFDVPRIARNYSQVDRAKDKGAQAAETLDWENRVRVTSDTNNVYIHVGNALATRPSLSFKDRAGNYMTFHQLANMSLTDKYMAWENPGGSPEEHKKLMTLLDLSSLLTYDSAQKRYRASLSNYAKVSKLLTTFFGKEGMESLVFEDLDGAYVFPAKEGRLMKSAIKHDIEASERAAPSKDLPLDDLKGFNYAPMLPPPGHNPDDPSSPGDFRDYQRKTINFMLTNDHTLLANDQGTGKTASILGAIMGRINRGQVRKALIICPANLVTGTWPAEIERWCKPAETVAKIKKLARGDAKLEAKLLSREKSSLDYELLTTKTREEFFANMMNAKGPVAAITSFEMANLYGKELQKLGFDLVTLDEAQNIKTGETKTRRGSKRSETIKDVFVDVPLKIASTGTPIENSIDDLHSIVSWLNPTLLGPAEDFARDFIETDYVTTPEGKKQAVHVAIKKPEELKNRIASVWNRVSKSFLQEREEAVLQKKLGTDYNKFLHYGEAAPRLVYPLVKIDDNGQLQQRLPTPEEGVAPYAIGHNDAALIDLKHPDVRTKYKDYIEAVNAANKHFTEHYKGGITDKTRYGQVNIKASAMLQKMQQVLNDPYILSKDPEFSGNPLFSNPNVANPKFDRLVSLLDKHCAVPYSANTSSIVPTTDILDKSSKEYKARHHALNESRGKVIVFCQSVEAMKSLKRRLDSHPAYKGRSLFYAGTEHIGDLMGVKGSGKQVQALVRNEFATNNNYDILVANDAAQTGLNFPQANLVVNYEMLWNPQAMNQRIDRAHRLGSQHRPVTAVNIAVNNTVETQKLRAQAYKQQLFDAVVPEQEGFTAKRSEGQAQFVASRQDLLKRKTFMGDDAAGLMDELINNDPALKDLQGASEKSIMRSKFLRDLAATKKASEKKPAADKSRGGVKRFLARWW